VLSGSPEVCPNILDTPCNFISDKMYFMHRILSVPHTVALFLIHTSYFLSRIFVSFY
jgi:hypothetical protein